MIPDWPLYFPLGPGYQLTHSLTGIFVACLPLGLALVLLFLVTAKRPLFELLPPGLQCRLAGSLNSFPERSALGILGMSVAVCIGAASHIVWDAFTHEGAWGVALLPSLEQVWITTNGIKFVGFMALQHGSSFVGFPLLLLLYGLWYRRAACQPAPDPVLSPLARWIWLSLLIGMPLAAIARHIYFMPQVSLRQVILALYYGVTEAGFMLIILVACYSLLFYPVVRYRLQSHS